MYVCAHGYVGPRGDARDGRNSSVTVEDLADSLHVLVVPAVRASAGANMYGGVLGTLACGLASTLAHVRDCCIQAPEDRLGTCTMAGVPQTSSCSV